MNVIIADTKSYNINGKSTGHYFAVAHNFCEALSDNYEVIIAGGPIYTTAFDNYRMLKYDSVEGLPIIVNKYRTIRNTVDVINNNLDSIIILQSNAVVTTFIGLLFANRHKNVYSIQYNLMALDSPFKRVIYKLAKSRIHGIICPSDDIGEAYGNPYCVVPDYLVTKRVIEKVKRPIHKKYDIGIVGIITKDKGVIEAAEALARTNLRIIIAGYPATEDICKRLKKACTGSSNIRLVLDYISDDEYDSYIRESRYCVLNYSEAYSTHSSGVVYDILYRGTPIVGKKCRFLNFVEEEIIGYVYEDVMSFDWEQLHNEADDIELKRKIEEYLMKQLREAEKLSSFLKPK